MNEQEIMQFIERWEVSGAAERANYQLFLSELCSVIGVPHPDPATPDNSLNAYVFERSVWNNCNDKYRSSLRRKIRRINPENRGWRRHLGCRNHPYQALFNRVHLEWTERKVTHASIRSDRASPQTVKVRFENAAQAEFVGNTVTILDDNLIRVEVSGDCSMTVDFSLK